MLFFSVAKFFRPCKMPDVPQTQEQEVCAERNRKPAAAQGRHKHLRSRIHPAADLKEFCGTKTRGSQGEVGESKRLSTKLSWNMKGRWVERASHKDPLTKILQSRRLLQGPALPWILTNQMCWLRELWNHDFGVFSASLIFGVQFNLRSHLVGNFHFIKSET